MNIFFLGLFNNANTSKRAPHFEINLYDHNIFLHNKYE